MGHKLPEYEIKNSEGVSTPIEGTTSSTIGDVTSIPAVADKEIESFTIENKAPLIGEFQSPNLNFDSELYVSIDGGTKFTTVYAGQAFSYKPKSVLQLVIKSNTANLPYEGIVNFEVFDEDA